MGTGPGKGVETEEEGAESSVSSFEEADESKDDNELSTQTSDELDLWEAPKTKIKIDTVRLWLFRCKEPPVSPKTESNSVGEDSEFPGMGGFLTNSRENPVAYSHTTTKHIPEALNISVKSAVFLKGLLVTRVMPSFYIFIILFSLPLNALALVTFTCKIQAKKPAVIFMSHLACVDLLFTLLLPLKIHYQLNASDWVFGEVACRVISAAYYCYMYCSILLMMCMSVDRLLAVAFPVASLTWRSARKATCVCVLVWLLALTGTVPLLSMRQTANIKDVGITCHDVLRHNDPTVLYYVYLFSILSCLYFFLPLVITLVSYFTIIYVLSVKSNRLATSSSSSDNRRRAVIMAIAVLIEFVVCFAPTNGILLNHCVHLAGGNSREGDSSYAAYLVAVCLGSTSVFLDPLLYYYGSSQCRQQIRSVFWSRKAKRAKTAKKTHEMLSLQLHNTKQK
ncbi:Proteinase-activated receptor 1 [Anabarilius grahami]|uniref:Proteinase-activated receptor 1 n=1 Tax=Anabarilius grahami TaxID=495550 RepID=A0A3N0XSQ1_ANAGA|nr:Proteinase-activated receptor 1 [Anabarilius grahami]